MKIGNKEVSFMIIGSEKVDKTYLNNTVIYEAAGSVIMVDGKDGGFLNVGFANDFEKQVFLKVLHMQHRNTKGGTIPILNKGLNKIEIFGWFTMKGSTCNIIGATFEKEFKPDMSSMFENCEKLYTTKNIIIPNNLFLQ